MPTLHDILRDTTNNNLAYRLKLLGVKPRSAKKADLVDAIKASLLGSGLKAIWSTLEDLEQSAVAEASHAPDLAYDKNRVHAKYGGTPSFCNPPKEGRSFGFSNWDPKFATLLNLFFFTTKHCQDRIVPFDLAERLREFVPKPSELSMPTLETPAQEEGLYLRETESEALSEVMALLRLAEQGNLSISEKTGMVSAAGCRKILECLSGGDFFPPEVAYPSDKKSYHQEIGAIKPFGWARLLQTGKYFTSAGAKSKLTPSGIKALSLAPHKIICHLWTKWLANTNYDEFNRINEIKGQHKKGHMTAKPPRRHSIEDALLDCPANKWVDVEKFSNHMLAAGLEFEVSKNVWKLYLCEEQYGNFGYAGYGGWNIVQFRYILCLLFEYTATLGLVDVAYVHPRDGLNDFTAQWGGDDLEWLSRYDGLRAFRITNLGAYCFGRTPNFKPTQPSSSLELTVLPSLSIRLRSGTPLAAEKLLLQTWAEPVGTDVWRLEPTRAREAVERGQSASDFAAFLQKCDNQPLPETVRGFLKTCDSDGKALRSRGEACLFECRDAHTCAMICAQPQLQNRCLRCGETQLVVPGGHLATFRKVVRSLGLGVS
ncbi:MAG: ribosomal protein S27E [Verrucomicrobiales bacterium]|jgi:ribosomal protein S27E